MEPSMNIHEKKEHCIPTIFIIAGLFNKLEISGMPPIGPIFKPLCKKKENIGLDKYNF